MADLAVDVSSKDHIAGPSNAAATLVEYGDYECPDCGVAFPIVKRLQKHFGERLRFVFRNFPLSQHRYAEAAAEAAEFAASKDKFWPMHDAIYEHQNHLNLKMLETLVEQLGLDPAELHTALGAHTFRSRVQADTQSGEKSGVRGTPTFFLNGTFFDEDYDFDTLVEAIDAALGNA